MDLLAIEDTVHHEVHRATMIHGPIRSAHEGYAVLREEVDELWDAIKANDLEHAMEEAVQVAAMGIRFIYDLSNKNAEATDGR